MTFWALVGLGYLLLLPVGVVIGRWVAGRLWGGGGRGPGAAPTPGPVPDPAFALDWAPLGSDFDRALLPAAFADEPLPVG
jgi:hypothetical protein